MFITIIIVKRVLLILKVIRLILLYYYCCYYVAIKGILFLNRLTENPKKNQKTKQKRRLVLNMEQELFTLHALPRDQDCGCNAKESGEEDNYWNQWKQCCSITHLFELLTLLLIHNQHVPRSNIQINKMRIRSSQTRDCFVVGRFHRRF